MRRRCATAAGRGRWVLCGLVIALLAAQAGTAGARTFKTGFLDPAAAASNYGLNYGTGEQMAFDAGARVVRLYARWRQIEPNSDAYDWTDITQQVQAARNANLAVMLTLLTAPDWAQQNNCGTYAHSRGACRPDPAAFEDFAHDIAAHFKALGAGSEVTYWGMWNEPNLPDFLAPQYVRRHGHKKPVSPSLYRTLVNRGARGVRSADPGALIVAGETAPFGHSGSISPLTFLRQLLCVSNRGKQVCRKSRVQADIWTTHPYTSGSPWHHAIDRNDVSFGDLGQWKRLVKGAARSGRFVNANGNVRRSIHLWDTEFSWDTKPPDGHGVPSRLHARWTSEALYRTWKVGIETLFWLQLRDYPGGRCDHPDTGGFYQSGFYRWQASAVDHVGRPKLSLTAFRFPFVAYASRGRIKAWGRTPDSNSHTVRIERKTSHGWHRVKTATASGQGIFTKAWSSGDTDHKYRAHIIGSWASVPFSLHRPRDLAVTPFGCG